MPNPVTDLFDHLSGRSRSRKMELLSEFFSFTGEERVLDLGSQVGSQHAQLLERFPNRRNVTAVNVGAAHLAEIKRVYPEVTTTVADARRLPFPDNSFDFVYSNAVIEHVGTRADQEAMAREIRRVGRAWFVTTPNRWFPFEFHTRLPFVSWLPTPSMRRVARVWAYNHVEQRYRRGLDFDSVNLMAATDLARMFPDSRIIKVRVTVWPETLIAVGPAALVDSKLPTSVQ